MEKRRTSTYLVLTGLLLLFAQAAGRTNYGNSSQISVTSEERRFEQNTIKNNTLGQNIPSNVGRRFIRNTVQGEAVFVGEGRRFVGDTVQISASSIAASDYTQCCWMCQQSAPDTSLYQFNTRSKKCFCRKPITGVTLATEILSLPVVSGFCDAVFTECLKEDNTYLTDGNPIQSVQVGGEDECANLCANTPECKFWHLYRSGNVCKLSKFSLRRRYTGIITGTKSCETGGETTTVSPLPTPPTTTQLPCPVGWTFLATGCYRFVAAGTHQQVTTNCENEGGFLIEINNQEEQDAAFQFYKDDTQGSYIWLGATDVTKEGEWIWSHSGNKMTFTAWNSGNPSNGTDENCLEAYGHNDLKWQDSSCGYAARGLCEYNDKPKTTPEPSESNCDDMKCLDNENCQGDHCVDACSDYPCSGGDVCLAEDHVASCVGCIEDQHCLGKEKCDITYKNCVDACLGHSCSGGNVCLAEDHEATCVGCIRDEHCYGNQKCDTFNNNCVECIGNNDCTKEKKCQDKKCQNVCTLNYCQGTDRKYCISRNHAPKCVKCKNFNDCEDDELCYKNKCHSICSMASCRDNKNNKHCIAKNHNYDCVNCIENDHCEEDEKCQSDECTPVCPPNKCNIFSNINKHCISKNHRYECVRCTENEHCDSNEKCEFNKCVPVCTSTTCQHYFDNRNICISTKHSSRCVQCSNNNDCSQSKKCENNECKDVCTSLTCSGNPKRNCKASYHNAECVNCTTDVHCDQDKKCDPENNECVDVCSDSQCSGANTKCVPVNHKPKCYCDEGYEYRENTCKLITKWTDWVDEGVCSEECGGGSQLQTRQCLDYQDNPLDEAKCSGQGSRYLTCNNQYCGVTATSPSGDPSKIIDGNSSTYFTSNKEDYPWLQLEYTVSREISGIRIELGEHQENIVLKDLEVRIGEINISKTMDPQTMNTLCKISENVSIPVLQVTQVDIACDKRLSGKFITVQKKLNDTQLHIFKIELMISCPESHPLASNNRKNCCPNSTDTNEECQDIKGCPDNLCIATNYIQFAANTEENVSGLLIGVIGVLLLIFTVTVFVLLLLKRKRSHTPKATQTNKKHAVTIVEIQPLTADHIIIKKPTNKKVKDKEFLKALKNTAKDSGALKREFRALEQLVTETIEVNKATTVGKLEENKTRNRYRDMVPYDHNIVYLEKPMGQPPSKYINASWITFPDDNQRYLAVQAPKVNMFSSFWQLVWEKKVGTIVMITDLEEGGKVKAHQYWPDKDNIVMDIDNGITLHYIKHEFPGTYYSRLIEVKYNNQKRMVNQIQTTAWLDLTAPKDSKILLDLVYKAQELLDENPGPVLVHCSAGVGRTGTFVGLYHLIKDYENDAVKEIDFYKTVLRMREQRMKMVQKHPQYHYIAKCLADYVSAQESEYG